MRADGCAVETNLLDHRRNELAEILCNTRVNHTYMTFSLLMIHVFDVIVCLVPKYLYK